MSSSNLLGPTAEGNLSANGYFDQLQVWLPRHAPPRQLAELAKHCGELRAYNKRADFSGRDRQRLVILQPRAEALILLTKLRDPLMNQVEIALDLTFRTPADRDDAREFCDRHLIRRWHGSEQDVFSVRETRYDASRAAPNQIVVYAEPYSRITGELNCLHIEWRSNRARAVRSAGISSPEDLLEFPFREFWSRRLLLVGVEEERFGRFLRNVSNGTRSRKSRIVRKGNREINIDWRLGHSVLNSYSSLQEVVDEYRELEVNRCFEVLPNAAFLPTVENQEYPTRNKGLLSYGAFGSVVTNRV